ncbi:MAG: hypothetical protein JXA49_07995 [Actinobacteria bacterium]|nr:hypothetical protein [Actinomycetota bacterium]
MDYLDMALLQGEFLPRVENLVTRVLLFEIDFQDVLKTAGELLYKYFIPIINSIPPDRIEKLRPQLEEILENFVGREIIVEIENINILKIKIGKYPDLVDLVSIKKDQAREAGLPGLKINIEDVISYFFQGIDGIVFLLSTGKIKAYDVEKLAEWAGGAISALRFLSASVDLLDEKQADALQVALISAVRELLDEYGV